MILSNDMPSSLEMAAASLNVNATSPLKRRYTASFPIHNISVSAEARLFPPGILSFMARIRLSLSALFISDSYISLLAASCVDLCFRMRAVCRQTAFYAPFLGYANMVVIS